MGQVAVDLLLEAIKAPDQQPEAGEVNRELQGHGREGDFTFCTGSREPGLHQGGDPSRDDGLLLFP